MQTAVTSPQSAPAISSHVPNKTAALGEEEPYTIRCICGFADDDGSTIYCELCDTWQHIECYYPHNRDEVTQDDYNHTCVVCKPRTLDGQRAKERQIWRQNTGTHAEVSERKATKRPQPKGQKKKARPTELGLNAHNGPENTPKQTHDSVHAHQHKKSKSSHRPSQSISSQAAKRSPSYGQKTTNPHGHPPSPATTPSDLPHEFEIHNYSSSFMDLYKEDRDVAIVQTNSFASLIISNILSAWLRDHEKLRHETGCDYDDVFRSPRPNIDSIKPSPQVRSKKLPVGSDTIAHWQYLASPQAVDKDVLLIELNGQIGIQKNYCEDPKNRYHELSSPLPFVFFHPMLPLYIDTRTEGSQARYVRRSCKSNAILDTVLSEGSEYHFWLVSDRPIRANEQITIPWQFNLQKDVAGRWLQLLGLNDDVDKQPEFNEKETDTYQSIAAWVHTILSEYGGCACDLGPDCAFARFHRTYIARQQSKDKGSKSKKSRKPKANNASPTSTGQATNSRAASEGHIEDGVDNDSTSSRSKPPSRDMTPAPRQGSFDTLGVLTELTDRDKRKVQMVEDSFRRMEQQQPPRKKKRISDGTSSSASATTTKPKSKATATNTVIPFTTIEARYVDAGTSGNASSGGSPISAVSPTSIHPFKQPDRRNSVSLPPRNTSQGPRPEYRDVAVQTDPVNGAWFSDDRPVQKPKRRIVSLSKRLLESRHRLRADDSPRRTSVATSPTSVASALVKMDLDSPTREQPVTPTPDTISVIAAQDEPVPGDPSDDVPMGDASIPSPSDMQAPAVHESAHPIPAKAKSPELRVQLPPVPIFNSSSVASLTMTPVSANESVIPSPLATHHHGPLIVPSVNGTAVVPSPKKKLSLSDYTKSRMNKAAAAAKSSASSTSLRPPNTIIEEAKSPVSPDTVMSEAPAKDHGTDP
ncbi:putative PHD-finger domain-containing protein [Rosellinia necatrix]|uniref:Putative PHD-finger domain-containing protein n=1 Tax=Rosellinia necatrix TaxID=77044 RepID=A0A1S7UIA4_ROSNE|nr:putative PHD-finger domain-containing protein [Rosellinia necatrix]